IYLTPITTDRATAREWFHRFEGAGLDGLIVKPPDDPYQPGKRVQLTVKHKRTADCVVAGFRTHKDGEGIGSLLLGIYDDEGVLHHVGVATSFNARCRKQLVDEVADLRLDGDEIAEHPWAEWYQPEAHLGGGRMPGAPNRWNAKKDMSWTALRPERVVEVTFEAVQNGRFRHSARFERWRPDRDPRSCTYDQFEPPDPVKVDDIFSA